MEVLLLVLIEAIVPLVVVAVMFAVELAFTALALLGETAYHVLSRRAVGAPQTATAEPTATAGATEAAAAPKRRVRWLHRAAIAAGVGFVLATIGIALVETVWYQPTLRWLLDRAERKTGIAVTYDAATGSFIWGTVDLTNVRAARSGHDVSNFDLTAEAVHVDVKIAALMHKSMACDVVELRGVRGAYERVTKTPPERHKRLLIDELTLRDAEIEMTDRTARGGVATYTLGVDTWTARDFDSTYAVYHVLLRSEAAGRVAGQPFTITQADGGDGTNVTKWRAEGLPVEVLGPYMGGPVAWIRHASLDVDVTSTWAEGAPDIAMRWDMTLREIKAEAPKDASLATKVLSTPIVALMNASAKRLPLSFDVSLDRQMFRDAWSPESTGLWDVVADGVSGMLARKVGLDETKTRQFGDKAVDLLKLYMDKKKTKQEAETKP
ncbi:MAG: hypothetical protein GC159_21360 [Phycisphaera sp.]|nr:hypothetical protein [Phycisphaera sp.]